MSRDVFTNSGYLLDLARKLTSRDLDAPAKFSVENDVR